MNHTPTPWRVGAGECTVFGQRTDYLSPIVVVPSALREDVAHIVKCVNAHEELVAVLTMLETLCVKRWRALPGSTPEKFALAETRAILAKVQS